jgi:sugar phosphate isomerase/epimerase
MNWYSSSMLLRGHGVVDAIETVADAGYDGIEVWVDQALAHGERASLLAERARRRGLGTTVHASSYDINLTAWNPGIRAESQRQTEASVRFAAKLGATIVVVHPGSRSSSRDDVEEYWQKILASLEPVDRLAEQLGVTVALELMERRPKEVVMLPEDGARVMRHGYRATRLTVDLAHAWSHRDPVEFLQDIPLEWIAHVHLSDSNPKTIHMPLGEGEIDLPGVYRGLVDSGYDGVVTVEGYSEGRGPDLVGANWRVIQDLVGEGRLSGPSR